MEELYEFLEKYEEEISRADADFDDLLLWDERKQLLLDTIIKEISRKGSN